MRLCREFYHLNNLLAAILIYFFIEPRLICLKTREGYFMNFIYFIHNIEQVSNTVLFNLKVIFNLNCLFNWTNFTHLCLCFRIPYIWGSIFLQHYLSFLWAFWITCNNSRLWHRIFSPNRFSFVLESLNNHPNHFFILLSSFLTYKMLVNNINFLLNIFTG